MERSIRLEPIAEDECLWVEKGTNLMVFVDDVIFLYA